MHNTIEEILKDALTAYNYEIFDTELYEDGGFCGYRVKSPNGYIKYLVTYNKTFNSLYFEKMENGILSISNHEWKLSHMFNEIIGFKYYGSGEKK
jgi:hypothetical protein